MSINIILLDFNTYINKIKKYYVLKAIKKLSNKDFAVLIINNKKRKNYRIISSEKRY